MSETAMNMWVSVNERMPEMLGEGDMQYSGLVDVLLDNGKTDEDFLINGKWVMYCTKNKAMPQIVAWKEKTDKL